MTVQHFFVQLGYIHASNLNVIVFVHGVDIVTLKKVKSSAYIMIIWSLMWSSLEVNKGMVI